MMHVFSTERLFQDQALRRRVITLPRFKHYECLRLAVADLDELAIALLEKLDVQIARLGVFTVSRGSPFIGRSNGEPSWNLKMLKLDTAKFDGSGITVGLIDTGVDVKHPAVLDRVTSWASVTDNGGELRFKTTGVTPGDSSTVRRHGTRVAGIICGQPFMGQSGTAPGAKLSVVKLPMDLGGAFSDEVLILALDHFCSKEVRIANISIESGTEEAAHEMIMTAAFTRNILPIVPIGNTREGHVGIPGRCKHAIGVGAVAYDGQMYKDSGSARVGGAIEPDLVAPGQGVYTLAFDEDRQPTLGTEEGTSFAAPHIAGLAARLLQQNSRMTATQLRDCIYGSCDSTRYPTRTARHVPDAIKALQC